MSRKSVAQVLLLAILGIASTSASAWFIFFPVPNWEKPPDLEAQIKDLEILVEPKALAYVHESKLLGLGSKVWVWGHFSADLPQEEVDRVALLRCETALSKAKSLTAGGKPRYDFGDNTCELHRFPAKDFAPRGNVRENRSVVAPTKQARPTSTPSVPDAGVTENANPQVPKLEQPAPSMEGAVLSPKATSSAPASSTTVGTPSKSDVATQPTSKIQPEKTSAPSSDGSVARKLRELNALRSEGLITESEYQEKRQSIISSM